MQVSAVKKALRWFIGSIYHVTGDNDPPAETI